MAEKKTRNRKSLPIGVSDFKEIVENNYYYIRPVRQPCIKTNIKV